MILLHRFFKITQKSPNTELEIAQKHKETIKLHYECGLLMLALLRLTSHSAGTVHKVVQHYTSQRCNRSSTAEKRNRMTYSEFRCISCGHFDHVEVNAAKNRLALENGESMNERGERRILW